MGGVVADCNNKVEGAGNTVQPQLAYAEDCVNAAGDVLLQHAGALAAVAVAFGLLVMLAACVAICYYYLVD